MGNSRLSGTSKEELGNHELKSVCNILSLPRKAITLGCTKKVCKSLDSSAQGLSCGTTSVLVAAIQECQELAGAPTSEMTFWWGLGIVLYQKQLEELRLFGLKKRSGHEIFFKYIKGWYRESIILGITGGSDEEYQVKQHQGGTPNIPGKLYDRNVTGMDCLWRQGDI